jgi:hypothetical protein
MKTLAAWIGRRAARKLVRLARLHGPGFLAWAVAMDLLDEVVLPGALALAGHPVLGGLVLAADLDWLTFPLYFAILAAGKLLKQGGI